MIERKRKFTRGAGVRLDLAVIEYLRQLAERDERTRSYCINRIVREHAQRAGCPLPAATEPPGTPPLSRPGEP